MLDEIGHQLLDQIGLLRDSLLRLWAAVLCMLACSLALGVSSLFSELGWATRPNPSPAMPLLNWFAMISFILGILVMMAGIVKAMHELRIALSPVAFEHDMIEASHSVHAENGDGEH